jgi:hypothetical protein
LLLPRVAVDQEQSIHARDHIDGCGIFGIHFHCVRLTKGDAALLRFAAAAEILESARTGFEQN